MATLLVGSSLLPSIQHEISRLTPQKIYIVGGTGVVPSEIESTLKSLFGDEAVVRISGPNRYETAVSLSEAVFTDAGAVDVVFLATGSNSPDALGAAWAAGHLGVPVLLVGSTLPGVVATEIARLDPDPVYVVGGSGVVPDAVLTAL